MNHEKDFETFILVQKKKKYTVLLGESYGMFLFFLFFPLFFHIHCMKLLLLFDKKVSHL